MEFRLVYDGKLPPAAQKDNRVGEKHEIRRALNKQLAELWKANPRLRRAIEAALKPGSFAVGGAVGPIRMTSQLHRPFPRCGRNFIPLIQNDSGVGCGLDILFLRRDQPGDLIRHGGDIDNGIKVLFDALRMPADDGEVVGAASDDDDPFYCLLEDDRLITDVKVTTDRLLTPIKDGEHIHDIRLVIHVRSVVIDTTDLGAIVF